MIGYSCKYAPLELIAAYGGKALMLDAETEDFSRAETLTHANVCCHAKALLTQALDISELVLTDCCDATRRTYDVLESEGRQRFLFQFDLPHDDAACARQRMTRELLRFAKAYGAYTGAAFSKAKFLAACRDNSHALLPNEPFIAVLGARVSPQLLGQIRCAFSIPVENLTCSGLRTLEEPPKEAADFSFEELMDWYAGALLRQTPCMRMTDIAARRTLYENEHIRGIVYNTVKFCDYYGFEYAELKAKSRIPLLKIESDYTVTAPGQLTTRLEAFRESLDLTAKPSRTPEPKPMNKHLFAGIDSGSTTTNMVVLDAKRNPARFFHRANRPARADGRTGGAGRRPQTTEHQKRGFRRHRRHGLWPKQHSLRHGHQDGNHLPRAWRAFSESRRPHDHRHWRAGQQNHQSG